jgi:hypothetical protein
MQTLEQSLADLVISGVVHREIAMTYSSRKEQLVSLVDRGVLTRDASANQAMPTLRVAGS